MKILTGPPGTGKTFRAVREAVRALEPDVPEEGIEDRHRTLMSEGRIVWVTFHPSYTYEDFIEGIRPESDPADNLIYSIKDGVFKKLCNLNNKGFYIGQMIKGYKVDYFDKGGVVLRKPNPHGLKSSDDTVGYADFWTIEHFKSKGLKSSDISIPGKKGGSPNPRKNQVAAITEVPPAFLSNGQRHKALWDFLDEEKGTEYQISTVMVIDEINRADLSRVFGELMTLLELDKRAGEPEEKRITLPYSGEEFTVPATLSVIGTMNTADRSLAVLDYALRRRFTFEEVAPDPLRCAGSYGGLNLGNYLTWMNRVVTALLSRDNRVGHVDLMQSRLEAVREHEGYPDDMDGELCAVAWTLRHKIAPLLLEYFHEDWQRASRALGQTGTEALLTEEDFSDIAGLHTDLELRSSYLMEDWWDPALGSWDPDRFRRYMLAIKDVGSLRVAPAAPAAAVAAPALTAPPTLTTTTATPLPPPEETPADADAAPAEQDDEELGAGEDQSAQE